MIVLLPEPFSPEIATIGNSNSIRWPVHPRKPLISIHSNRLDQAVSLLQLRSSRLTSLLRVIGGSRFANHGPNRWRKRGICQFNFSIAKLMGQLRSASQLGDPGL